MTDREAIVIIIDALLRKGTVRDGNWGHPSFHEELSELQRRYGSPPTSSAGKEPK